MGVKIAASGAITTAAQGTGSPVLAWVGGDLMLDCDCGWLAVGPRILRFLRTWYRAFALPR